MCYAYWVAFYLSWRRPSEKHPGYIKGRYELSCLYFKRLTFWHWGARRGGGGREVGVRISGPFICRGLALARKSDDRGKLGCKMDTFTFTLSQ